MAVLRRRSRTPAVPAPANRENIRATHPTSDERVDVARGLQRIRNLLIRRPAYGAGLGIFETTGGSDHDQATERKVGSQRHMKGHPGAQRVPQQGTGERGADRPADRLGDQTGRSGQVCSHRVGSAVTRQIDSDQRVLRCQGVTERAPQPTGLREPVQEHQRWTRPRDLDMEPHGR